MESLKKGKSLGADELTKALLDEFVQEFCNNLENQMFSTPNA